MAYHAEEDGPAPGSYELAKEITKVCDIYGHSQRLCEATTVTIALYCNKLLIFAIIGCYFIEILWCGHSTLENQAV